jgi:hypothetical protein
MRLIILTVIGLFVSILTFAQSATRAADSPDTGQTTHPAGSFVGSPAGFGADFFPILPWSPVHGWRPPYGNPRYGVESMAECNFTVAGFARSEDLPLCERLGLAAIMAPPDDETPWKRPWRTLSDQEIDARVRMMVEWAGKSPAVMGYYIMDEPGTRDFAALAKAVAAVKKHAPGKLAYINLFPGYATIGAPDKSQLGAASFTEYLERYAAEVKPQFISYDNYMIQYSDDLLQAERARSYFADLLEVRRVAMRNDLPFWNIVSSNQIRKYTTIPSPANMMLQAYTTLAAGGRGLSWYTYYGGSGPKPGYAYAPIDHTGNKTETWGYLQLVNHQIKTLGLIMNRLKSTGVFFAGPGLPDSLPLLAGRIVREAQAKASPRGFAPTALPVMVGEFQDATGVDHLMIVNLSLERSANIRLQTHKTYVSKQVFSAQDGHTLPLDEENGLWLTAGQGALIRVE